jgi:hypothetical protein
MLRLGIPRHGGRRPAIHVFTDQCKRRRGWPAFADHDDASHCIVVPVGPEAKHPAHAIPLERRAYSTGGVLIARR